MILLEISNRFHFCPMRGLLRVSRASSRPPSGADGELNRCAALAAFSWSCASPQLSGMPFVSSRRQYPRTQTGTASTARTRAASRSTTRMPTHRLLCEARTCDTGVASSDVSRVRAPHVRYAQAPSCYSGTGMWRFSSQCPNLPGLSSAASVHISIDMYLNAQWGRGVLFQFFYADWEVRASFAVLLRCGCGAGRCADAARFDRTAGPLRPDRSVVPQHLGKDPLFEPALWEREHASKPRCLL
jgi:hypothetical protein